ncbi:MAG: ROK family transcriptional regulator [Actinomycetia bacterium]|nr:ROK family transcriptional regulator [Actinomycetes bacterium]
MPQDGARPASPAVLRQHNLALVLQALGGADEPLSRAELAEQTGLGRATLTRLVPELIAAAMVEELARPGTDTRGRPATPLRIAEGSLAGLGLEVNVSFVALQALDLAGSTLAEQRIDADFAGAGPEPTLRRLGDAAAELVADLSARTVGATLAVPGMVWGGSQVTDSPNLGWRELAPLPLLGPAWAALQVPTEVCNDANLQALATAYRRPGRLATRDTFLYLAGDYGVGGALVRDGLLTDGEHGWAGEIGHTCIEPYGPRCHCGATGCLETYAGQNRILEAAGLPAFSEPSLLLTRLHDHDKAALAAVERAGWALGIAIANTLNVADVSHVVLGTGLGRLLPWLRPALEAELRVRVLAAPARGLDVSQGRDLAHPACTGGALAVMNRLLTDPASHLGSPVR